MDAASLLVANLLSPVVLAFLVGMAATLLRSELEFPQPVLNAISIYLVFAIALKGGTELAAADFAVIWKPVLVSAALALLIPVLVYAAGRRVLRLGVADAAGLAALYGSVSSVTFLAALTFAAKAGTPAEPFMPVLVSVMEWGILVALFIARWAMRRESAAGAAMPIGEIVVDTLRGRSVVLMLGGLAMGYVIGEEGFASVKLVFEDAFRGILVLFLLEMGMVAARQLKSFWQAGPRLLVFGVLGPVVHGCIGVWLGQLAGLSQGGAFVLGAMAGSASYIDAPAAVRAALPQANPSIYLTSSLGITFPYNLLFGIPLLYAFSGWLFAA
ncbi:MAG: sodium-dependent bicarbonate transport family permease [Opitutaceae bacterium]|jgi:hypothetical protein|nr:sodium-dependent bicarbonate transport family permease [Opitutaceae bacterium]